jgi:hypothetical protein
VIIYVNRFSGLVGDPLWNYVVLLLHGEGTNGGTTFTDSSQYARSPTSSPGVVTDTGNPYYGSSAIYANDKNAHLVYTSTDFDISGKNATFEWYWKTGTLDNIQTTGTRFTRNNDGAYLGFGWNGTVAGWGIDTPTSGFNDVGYFTFASGTYRHVCVEIDSSGAAILYINGVQKLNWSQAFGSGGTFTLEFNPGAGSYTFQQWFDEVRVTVGSPNLRYGGSFTPPTPPLLDY